MNMQMRSASLKRIDVVFLHFLTGSGLCYFTVLASWLSSCNLFVWEMKLIYDHRNYFISLSDKCVAYKWMIHSPDNTLVIYTFPSYDSWYMFKSRSKILLTTINIKTTSYWHHVCRSNVWWCTWCQYDVVFMYDYVPCSWIRAQRWVRGWISYYLFLLIFL